jgi:hypothetical protein
MAITMGPMREARFSQMYQPLSMKDVGQARAIVSPTPLTPGYRAALSDYAQRNSGFAAAAAAASSARSNTPIHPWDSFYNAGTIHASHEMSLQEWNEDLAHQHEDEEAEDYYDENESESIAGFAL